MSEVQSSVAKERPRHWIVRPGRVVRWGLLAAVVVLQACATVANPDPRDPMESWNRGVFQFNDAVDRAVVKPVATAYRDVLPHWMRTGVNNFFANLEDLWSGAQPVAWK